MFSPWLKQQQRRRQGPTVQRSNRGDVRLVVSATTLSAVLLIIFLLSMCTNWLQYKELLISIDGYGNKNFELPKPISDNNVNSTNYVQQEVSKLPTPIQRGQRRSDSFFFSLRKAIETNSRLPETKDHLIKLSISSEVDVDDLGIKLANKSVDVYRPGSWDGAGVVIEEFKLVFFTQGKVACTVFKQLFRRMMHIENWMVDSSHLPHNPKRNGLTYLYHYSVADALTILTHPSWTRAIFVRDPKERTLSAFLDKAARKNGKYVNRHCCNERNSTCGKEANASFLGFLRVVEERCCCDPHWKPQTKRVDKAFMPFINFVGHFDRIQIDTERLLKRLNSNVGIEYPNGISEKKGDLWTTFGASGWGIDGNESIFSKDTKAKHRTSAMTKLRQYYNATTEMFVEKLFAGDYEDPILNFTRFSLFEEKEIEIFESSKVN